MGDAPPSSDGTIYRGEYIRISEHRGTKVAVQVGRPPEKAPPTIEDASGIVQALSEHLRSEASDG